MKIISKQTADTMTKTNSRHNDQNKQPTQWSLWHNDLYDTM